MISAEPTELLVRATALYLPIVVTVALVIHRQPDRRRVAAAVLATAWNLPALLAVNLVAQTLGWWRFQADAVTVSGVPVDLWVGWAVLWGAVPILATTDRLVLCGVVLFAADLVLMPLAEPVVALDASWLVGEGVALAGCLLPGLVLGRWTAAGERVGGRAVLQVVGFTGLVAFVLPSVVFAATGESWAPLLSRPIWQLVLAGLIAAPAGALAVQAVREFADHGGTPVPLDPPTRLVTSGPYAYVANPMQLGGTVVLATEGVLLASPMIVAAAVMAAVFSTGIAAWSEQHDLDQRFGPAWHEYRRMVRPWLPRWHPAPARRAFSRAGTSGTPLDP